MPSTRAVLHAPRSLRPGLILHLLLGCYVAIAAFMVIGLKTWDATLKGGLLAFQYVILLPGIIWYYLASRRGAGEKAERWPPRFPALLVYGLAAIPLAWFLNQAVYSADESAYLFQARIFSTGHLTAEAPLTKATDQGATLEDFRIQHHLIVGDKWFGKYSPGWPAILAIGTALHSEWLINPLLGMLILIITYRTALLVFDRATAGLANLILVASPFFVLNCVDFMSHTACSVFIAGATYFFFAYRYSSRISGFISMLALIGMACMVRPYPAAFIGVTLCAVCFWSARRESARLLKLVSISLAAGGATLASLLAYNRALTGEFWPVTYAVYRNSDTISELNFSPGNLFHNMIYITSVSVAATVLAAFPFVMFLGAYALFREREKRLETRVLAASFGVLILVYLGLVEHSFSFIGERYYFETYFALAILAAHGWRLLVRNWNISARAVRVTVTALLLVQAIQYPLYIRIAANVRHSNRLVQTAVAHLPIKDAVVFLKFSRKFRAFDLNLNRAGWKQAPVFYIKDPGERRRDTVACALGRSRWMVVTYDDRRGVPVIESPVMSRCGNIATTARPSL